MQFMIIIIITPSPTIFWKIYSIYGWSMSIIIFQGFWVEIRSIHYEITFKSFFRIIFMIKNFNN